MGAIAGGLITVVDGKPGQVYGEIVEEYLGAVHVEVWRKLLGDKPVTVQLVDSISSPAWAEGKWITDKRLARVVRMARADGKPRVNRVAYTALHEVAGHGSDSSVLDDIDRAELMALMDPKPDSWRDTDGAPGMAAYWRLPYEAYANRIVEALVPSVTSPYDDDYVRWIPRARLPKLLEIATRPTPTPTPPPPTVEEPPPSDRELELEARVVALQTALDLETKKVALYDAQTLEASEALWRPEWGAFPPKPGP